MTPGLNIPLEKMESSIKDISNRLDIHFIKTIGDAFLLFIEGIHNLSVNHFLDFISDTGQKSIDGYFDTPGFSGDLRFAAHSGECAKHAPGYRRGKLFLDRGFAACDL